MLLTPLNINDTFTRVLEVRNLLNKMILEMYRAQMIYEDFSNNIRELYVLHDLLVYSFYELILSIALAMGILDISTKTLSKLTMEFISCSVQEYRFIFPVKPELHRQKVQIWLVQLLKDDAKDQCFFQPLVLPLYSLCLHGHKRAAPSPGIMFMFQVERRGRQNTNKCKSAE